MAAHGGRWVGEGGAELDCEAVGGVGVVGCPGLRPVVGG